MNYTDLNRLNGMGANCHYVEIGPFNLVIDCGIDPANIGERVTPNLSLIEDKEVDLAILTHCHLDHLGSLPVLLKHKPNLQILMSIPSEYLFDRMLHNSVNVMRRQREEQYLPEYPLYNHEDVDRLPYHAITQPYGQPKIIEKDGEELTIILHPAGHVIGAIGVELVYKHRRIFFTGDVQFDHQTIISGAKFPTGHIDTLVMETTRGATDHDSRITRNGELRRLVETCKHTLEAGGSVLIPVFALGRMQDVLNVIHKARMNGDLPITPVYSSGLGMDLADYIDKISKRTELCTFTSKVMRELRIKPVRNIKPGKRPAQPGLYICSSGMLVEHTPSYKVASSLLPFNENTICFVGYCAPDTAGAALQATKPGELFTFETLNISLPLKARIKRFELSGHANRDELMKYALSVDPRSILLTHGDPDAKNWFANEFEQLRPEIQITLPESQKTFVL